MRSDRSSRGILGVLLNKSDDPNLHPCSLEDLKFTEMFGGMGRRAINDIAQDPRLCKTSWLLLDSRDFEY